MNEDITCIHANNNKSLSQSNIGKSMMLLPKASFVEPFIKDESYKNEMRIQFAS